MVRRKVKSELELAEVKLRSLIERRDALNAEAAVFRDERDLLNKKRKEVADELRALRGERDALVREMREHRAKRNELQAKAKELIELKRKVRTQVRTSIGGELDRMRREVKGLEMKQQTASLKLDQENALLDDLRHKLREVRELEALRTEQDKIGKDIHEIDDSINDLFRSADKEHDLVVKLGNAAKEKHDRLLELSKQADDVAAQADKKHGEFLEIRTKADALHEKAVEMREKVLTIRGTQRAEIREARGLLRQQNLQVRKALLDERKLDKAADDAVQVLLRKGRVELKG